MIVAETPNQNQGPKPEHFDFEEIFVQVYGMFLFAVKDVEHARNAEVLMRLRCMRDADVIE